MTHVLLLGSGGWIPTSRRATCSALVRQDEHALVIDAGTGVGRLIEDPGLLDGISRLDFVLTHFHLDHVVGLASLPALSLPKPPGLHGPGAWLYRDPTEAILARLVGPPLFPIELDRLVAGIGEISADGLEIGPFQVRVRVQERHNHPTLALRVDDVVTYCTDTAYDDGNAEFARGSRILAHEAWYTEDDPRDQTSHSSALDAARIAGDADVTELVLIHIRPGADKQRLEDEARASFGRAVVGEDLQLLAEIG
jgi:ribonuclease BN (tRNA processing enzyme)